MVGGGEVADSESQRAARRRRLEIIHESLLTQWPRLVRWRAQDAEGAVLRDQLRQAALLWEQRSRSQDFLWTGTAYREYQLWRERYAGGLTTLEETFARAMAAFVQRRRHRRHLAVAAVITLLTSGLAIVAVLRQQAVAQARRAEASKLLALGQVELESSPTAALAYAIRSIQLDDSRAARLFALRALAAGPPAFLHTMKITDMGPVNGVAFSPDGAWAVVTGSERLHVVGRDGSSRLLESFPSGTGGVSAVFDSTAARLYAAKDGVVRIWGIPAFELEESQKLGGTHTSLRRSPAGILATTRERDTPVEVTITLVAAGSRPRSIARIQTIDTWTIDPAGTSVGFARDKGLYIASLGHPNGRPLRVGTYGRSPRILFHPSGDRLAAHEDLSGQIRLWAAEPGGPSGERVLAAPFEKLNHFTFDLAGERLGAVGKSANRLRVAIWDLDAPADTAAQTFPAAFGGFLHSGAFSPDGRWLATANFHAVCFWPLTRPEPRVLPGDRGRVTDVGFTPDGRHLVSLDGSGEVRQWDLGPGGTSRPLAHVSQSSKLDIDRRGRFVAVGNRGGALVVPLTGGDSRALEGFLPATTVAPIAIDPDGRRVAVASMSGPGRDKVIRVWDLDTDEVRRLGPTAQAGEGSSGQIVGLGFLADGSLVSSGDGGLRRWSLQTGSHEVLAPSFVQSQLTAFSDGRSVAYIGGSDANTVQSRAGTIDAVPVAITDVGTRATRILGSHGGRVMTAAVDRTGTIIVTGSHDGIVRVGRVTGEEPHLLIGHEGWVLAVDVSPDGRWIASSGDDGTIRIWPMPDLSKPPLHVLPRDELLAKLESLTNVRVVEESQSTTSAWLRTRRGSGYELEILPFPGWAKVPEW